MARSSKLKPGTKMKAAADTARPYVERALTDEEFRESLRSAFVAAKEIYEELVPQKSVAGVASKVAMDEDLQQSVKSAMAELRHAADRLQAERKSHTGRNILLVLVGVAIGILFNPFTGPDTRRWVRGRVSGGDFAYNGHSKAETISG